MPADRVDAEMAEYCGSFTVSPRTLRVTSASNAFATALARGFYDVESDVDAFFLQGPAGALTVAATNGVPLTAGSVKRVPVTGALDSNVAVICATGVAGYVYFSPRVPT